MTVKRDISALKQEQIRQDFMNRRAALLQENRNEKDATTEERANRLKNCLTTALHTTSAEKTEETVHNKHNHGTVG